MSLPDTLVMPISGQALTVQIGILLTLIEKAKYCPSLCLGASGGAMVGLMAIKYNWNRRKIMDFLESLHDTEFIKNHSFTMLQGLWDTSLFKIGSGLCKIYDQLSDYKTCNQHTELILMAYNMSLARTELFSTKSKTESVMSGASKTNLQLFGVSKDIHYLGSLDKDNYPLSLRDAIFCTSAVPGVMPPAEFDGNFYQDGGVSFTSPLNPVSVVVNLNDVLYITPTDIDHPPDAKVGNAVDNLKTFFSQSTRAKYLQERVSFLSKISGGDLELIQTIRGRYESGKFWKHLNSTVGKSRFVELFPISSVDYSMLDIQSLETHWETVAYSSQDFGYRIFYI